MDSSSCAIPVGYEFSSTLLRLSLDVINVLVSVIFPEVAAILDHASPFQSQTLEQKTHQRCAVQNHVPSNMAAMAVPVKDKRIFRHIARIQTWQQKSKTYHYMQIEGFHF